MLPGLARDRQVIADELQATASTATPTRASPCRDLTSDVVALLDELGVEQADFFGFSLGGLTSLQVAVTHPQRVGRLVLASTHYRQDGYYDEVRSPPTGARRDCPREADFEEMAHAYAEAAPDPGHFQDFLAKCTAAAGRPGLDPTTCAP